jgi:hypothetical protein
MEYLRGKLPENYAYGHQAVFARYLGIKVDKLRIFARYMHGFNSGAYWNDDRIPSLVWSQYNLREAQSLGLQNYHAIGAPLLYLSEKYMESNVGKFLPLETYGRARTLCIAPHSIFDDPNNIFESQGFEGYFPYVSASDRFKFYAESCLSQSSNEPLVMLHYKDYTEEVVSKFAEYGIETMTLGDGLFNKQAQEFFLGKQIALLKTSKEVLVCDANTTWAYSGYLEIPFKVMKGSIYQTSLERIRLDTKGLGPEDSQFYDRLLGSEFKKSPTELLELFGSKYAWNVAKNRFTFVCKSFSNLLGKI